MTNLREVWVYLAASPLLHLTLTLAAYTVGYAIYRRLKFNPLMNPVAIATGLVVAFLLMTKTSYETYFQGAQFVHFLLGPATVALAVPLYRQIERLKRSATAVAVGLTAGSLIAALTAVAILEVMGGSRQAMASIAPKSVTAPVAMGIAKQLDGLPSLTAVLVILTGIAGAALGPPLMTRLSITSWAARGLAMGVAAHGIGTARALQVNETAGAFAGLGMGLNALITAIYLPPLLHLLF